MSVHAWCGHLDGSRPVEVEVAQGEGQVLDVKLGQARVVLATEEMSWQHAAHVNLNSAHVEVKLALLATGNQVLINDTTGGGILDLTRLRIKHKESLRNSLIYDDHSNLWHLKCLILIDSPNSILELGDFLLEDLFTLCITDTVSVEYKVGWRSLLVADSEGLNRLNNRIFHVGKNNFLSLLLNEVLTEVLTHLWVDTGTETNDRSVTSVAHINTEQHSRLAIESFGELESVQISADFAVNLTQDVRGL